MVQASAHLTARFVQHQPQTHQNNTPATARAPRDPRLKPFPSWLGADASTHPQVQLLLWLLLFAWLMLRWPSLPAGLRLSCTPSCPRRFLSTTRPVCADSSSRWGNTLLLPKTAFPLYNDPSKDPNLRNKTTEDLYRWQVGMFGDKPPSLPLMLVSFSGSMRKALSLSFTTARPTRMVTCIWVSSYYCSSAFCALLWLTHCGSYATCGKTVVRIVWDSIDPL